MRKSLTKNARWIIFWARYQSADSDLYLPKEVVFNLGRHSYETPTMRAITEQLDFSGEKILASQIYEVDVAVYPYAKQHEQVTGLANKYFSQRRIVT